MMSIADWLSLSTTIFSSLEHTVDRSVSNTDAYTVGVTVHRPEQSLVFKIHNTDVPNHSAGCKVFVWWFHGQTFCVSVCVKWPEAPETPECYGKPFVAVVGWTTRGAVTPVKDKRRGASYLALSTTSSLKVPRPSLSASCCLCASSSSSAFNSSGVMWTLYTPQLPGMSPPG